MMKLKNKLSGVARIFRNDSTEAGPVARAGFLNDMPAPAISRGTLLEFIPLEQSLTDRWDHEWLHYFLTEDPRPFLVGYQHLNLVDKVQGKRPPEVYHTSLVSVDGLQGLSSLGELGIWVNGDDLAGKNVLEIGCGPGFLGKQLSKIVTFYLGIDYSKLALHIARLTSPSNCTYYHLSELTQIIQHASTIDTMVGRNFFIHQNYRNLIWLLKLAEVLLKPGGLISADFYLGNPAVPQGVIHTAHSNLDQDYPSCGFEYTVADIEQAATETGFQVETIAENPDWQRRFVFFRKPNITM